MRRFLSASLLIFIGAIKINAQEKPIVIFILTDDMVYSDINCFGGDFVPRPNIDRIAEAGM